jgi:lauroyl/myristoyl acyltransferase
LTVAEREEVALARKAAWAYGRAAARLGLRSTSAGVFELEHLRAWEDHRRSADATVRGARLAGDVPDLARQVVVTWHFPEYPLLLPLLGRQRALVLIAERAAWLEESAHEAELCLFREPGGALAVARAFRDGRPVVAMLDYCYDDTSAVLAPFCGYPARTPAGVFRLAHRFGYALTVVEIDESGRPRAADSFAPGPDAAAAAARTNAVLEQLIFSAPPRWLLWASIDRRWVGVDYDEEPGGGEYTPRPRL